MRKNRVDAWPDPAISLSSGDRDAVAWEHALEAAAARLIETAIEQDSLAHMEQSVMANELAAQLCAYGLAADEVEHKLEHEADLSGRDLVPIP